MCNGQSLEINQNELLFSLIGTTYGGDGTSTFQLPDFRGRVPIHMGQGVGLSYRTIVQSFGTENETLTVNNLPAHTHPLNASSSDGTAYNPSGNVLAASTGTVQTYNAAATSPVSMNAAAVGNFGGGESHTNVMPTLCINFIIALDGNIPYRD
jgi:microcystin-dependent protein